MLSLEVTVYSMFQPSSFVYFNAISWNNTANHRSQGHHETRLSKILQLDTFCCFLPTKLVNMRSSNLKSWEDIK